MTGRLFVLPVLLATAVFAQGSRTFYFTHGESPQNLQNVVNIVRSIGDIRDVSSDPAKNSVTVQGTSADLALAEWLCHELDQPSTPRDYLIENSDTPVVRIYYLNNIAGAQALQEVVNALRSVSDLQRAFPYAPQQAIAIRGNAAQAAVADWLLGELNQTGERPNTQEYKLGWVNGREGQQFAQVFYTKNVRSAQGLQELVNATRSIADIQRFFPFNPRAAIVARGSADQLAAGAWLLQQIDVPTVAAGLHEYKIDTQVNPMVRVIAVSKPPQEMQVLVNEVRSTVNIQRIYPINVSQAVALRGTADQISRAAELLK